MFGLDDAACSLRCELDESNGGGDSGAARKRAIDDRLRSGDVSGVAGLAAGCTGAAAAAAAATEAVAAGVGKTTEAAAAPATADDETEVVDGDDADDKVGEDGVEADGDDGDDDVECGGGGRTLGGGDRKTSAGALMAAAVHVKGACASEPQR